MNYFTISKNLKSPNFFIIVRLEHLMYLRFVLIFVFMKIKFFSIFALLLGINMLSAQTTRVFGVAHQDDWQLFMNPYVANSIQNAEDKTVIIHLTAGDAGYGMGNDAFYKAREEGALRAVRFLSNTIENRLKAGNEMSRSITMIRNHPILTYSYHNTVVYFLRLPDGNGDGSGFSLHNQKSLEKFYNRQVVDFIAIDQSTTYTNKEDLLGTLKELITTTHTGTQLEIHLTELSEDLNVDDHSDHLTASRFIAEAATNQFRGEFYYYIDYQTANLEGNLERDEILINSGTWGATASGLSDQRHASLWDEYHTTYLDRQYYRVLPISLER